MFVIPWSSALGTAQGELDFAVEQPPDWAGAVVLRVAGEVDALTQAAWEGVLATVLEIAHSAGADRLVVDLGQLAFCSVAGLHAVSDVSELAADDGLLVTVTAMRPVHRRMVDLLWPVVFPPADADGAARSALGRA